MIRPSSTAFRFAAFYSLAFTALILVLGVAVYGAIRRELRYELDQRVATERAAVLREAAGRGLPALIADRARHERGDMRYALLGPSGRSLAGSRVAEAPAAGWSTMDVIDAAGQRDRTRVFASKIGDATLVIGADPEAIEELDEHMVPLLAVAFGLTAVIGIAGAFLLSGALGRRLDAINHSATAIIGGDLARRMPLSGSDDEFDRLSLTLNLMLDRIAGLLDNVRQVSSDVAHDLRTPIARLRQKLDVALTGRSDEAALRAAMRHAIAQTDEMLDLFAAILGIAEIEASGAVRMAPLDLSALAGDLADSYAPVAEDGRRAFTRSIDPAVEIDGNRELVAQLVVNLLDNAINHTPAGTPIEMRVEADDRIARLTVADHGPGIPVAERERVMERFTRLERSRSTSGHGLGLSLVSAIAKAHRGAVHLHDNHPGVRAMATFPRRAA